MAADLQQTVGRLRAKLLVLADRFNLVSDERTRAQARVAQLEGELDQARKRIESLECEVEFLKVATTLSPKREDVENTRQLLIRMIRDIDNCIADLKE